MLVLDKFLTGPFGGRKLLLAARQVLKNFLENTGLAHPELLAVCAGICEDHGLAHRADRPSLAKELCWKWVEEDLPLKGEVRRWFSVFDTTPRRDRSWGIMQFAMRLKRMIEGLPLIPDMSHTNSPFKDTCVFVSAWRNVLLSTSGEQQVCVLEIL